MLQPIKNWVKRILPEYWLILARPYYHGAVARLASYYFGEPSKKLIVIGVTGTKGKTTTTNLIAAIIRESGKKVGYASTATYSVGDGVHLNTFKMSTMSGWTMQKWLAAMVKNGCSYAVMEMTSEGLAQNRHNNIYFDMAVFTNLTPEHLDSHGSFENYQRAKGRLFKSLSLHPITPEKLHTNPKLQKTIVANLDSQYGQYFLNFKASQRVSYGVKNETANVRATDIQYGFGGIKFKILGTEFSLALKGKFDVYNALAATAAAFGLDIDLATSSEALSRVTVVPGRMEVISTQPFTVLVDYAHEPNGMQQLYSSVTQWQPKRIIQVLGPTGGGRDFSTRSQLGALAGKNADIVIITTDDPYDDDPAELAKIMLEAAISEGKILNKNLFVVLDRRAAIAKALALGQPGDLVLITGKGSEQKMILAGGKIIDWDDRTVAREELTKLTF
jgi:UDP-N-acetylmuramoyl-L-alanyl-D-glutamate--2,6-diaminopimelate ligase